MFLINLIPLHVLVLMVTGRFNQSVYIAYSTLYVLGTVLSMQISFVGFQPLQTSEHMGAFGVFGLCQIYGFVLWLQSKLSAAEFRTLFRFVLFAFLGAAALGLGIATFLGKIAPWTGR